MAAERLPRPDDDRTIGARSLRPQPVLARMRDPLTLAFSVVPVLVFVTANAFLALPWTVGISVAAGLAITGFQLLRGEPLVSAAGSLIGVAVAAVVVVWTGDAKDFFVIGIWASLTGFLATAGSIVLRRPLTGVVWNTVHGGGHHWRSEPGVLRAHDLATLALALSCGLRFAIQQWLYLADDTSGLGIARLATGPPLTVLAALVIIWAARRSTTHLTGRARPS